MNAQRKWFVFALVGAVLLVAALVGQAALRQPVLDARNVTLAPEYTLESAVAGDVVAFAETIELRASSVIEGDAALVGGQMKVSGTVDGSLTVMGDSLRFGADALIHGDASLLVRKVILDGQINGIVSIRGEEIEIAPGAQLKGAVYACASLLVDAREGAAAVFSCENAPSFALAGAFGTEFPFAVQPGSSASLTANLLPLTIGALLLACLSILAVVLFPRQISHMEEAVRSNPRGLAGAGFMLLLLALGITFAYGLLLALLPPLGVLLLPVLLAAALVITGMLLGGWIAVALLIGDLLLRRLSPLTFPPLVTAVAGNLTLAFFWVALALLPYGDVLALLIWLVTASVGLGAALFTRMGTRPAYRTYFVHG